MADAVAVSWRNLFSIFDPTTLDKTARTHTWFNTHKMCVKHKKGVKKWIAKKGVGQTRNQRVFWRRPARSAATYSLTTTSAVGWLTFTPPLQPLSSVFVFCFFLFFFFFCFSPYCASPPPCNFAQPLPVVQFTGCCCYSFNHKPHHTVKNVCTLLFRSFIAPPSNPPPFKTLTRQKTKEPSLLVSLLQYSSAFLHLLFSRPKDQISLSLPSSKDPSIHPLTCIKGREHIVLCNAPSSTASSSLGVMIYRKMMMMMNNAIGCMFFFLLRA